MADQSETRPDNGIEIEIHWFDDDVIELLVRASNGHFTGMVEPVIPVEPYAIDRFVQHLGHLEVTCGASARLQGAV